MSEKKYKLVLEVNGYAICKKYLKAVHYGFLGIRIKWEEAWGYLAEDFNYAYTQSIYSPNDVVVPIKYYETKKEAMKYLQRLNAGTVNIT